MVLGVHFVSEAETLVLWWCSLWIIHMFIHYNLFFTGLASVFRMNYTPITFSSFHGLIIYLCIYLLVLLFYCTKDSVHSLVFLFCDLGQVI